MDIKVDIDPNQVNQELARAILGSVVGEQIKAAIEKNIKEIGQGHWNPIQTAIHQVVTEIVMQEVRKREEEIRTSVATIITSKMIQDVVEKFEEWMKKRY